jgi:succinoglycan biosynthesis transport protein ExoP
MLDAEEPAGPDAKSPAATGPTRLTLASDYGSGAGPSGPSVPFGVYGQVERGGDPFFIPRLIYRWRLPAVTVFLLIMIGTALYTFTAVPIYQARTRVLVQPERLNILKIEDVLQQDRSLDAQVAVLQSRWLAKATMETMNLLQPAPASAEAAPAPAGGISGLWSRTVSYIQALVSRAPAQTPALPGEIRTESGQIDAFLGGLNVATATKGVMDITYTSTDAVMAARIANGIAQQYMTQNREVRFAAVKEVSEWLSARLAEQRQKVDAAEQALQRFRSQNQIVVAASPDTPAIAKLNELITASTRAQASRIEAEAMLDKVKLSGVDPAALLRLPQMAADGEVQRLRVQLESLQNDRAVMAEKLQDRHPDMIKIQSSIRAVSTRLESETSRVIASMQSELAAARTTERNLMAAVDRQRDEALAMNRKGVDLGVLERDVNSSREIYEMLMQRAREANITKDIRPSEIQILDPAEVPTSPISPRPSRNMTLAALAGLALAFASALGLDQLDSRIKRPEEIMSRLGIPLLGFVPEVHPTRGQKGPPVSTMDVPPIFREAMRSVRTNVLYSFAEESLKSIVITSAGISEGKTVFAANLAIAMAQSSQRVLLIDADMRRPTLHTVLSVNRQPGLSNLLVGKTNANDVIQRTNIPNLWILPSGHRPPNPPELLASDRFDKMMKAFGDHFDWVVIDAPPVMPVTDAIVLAQKSTGVLFVVGAERVSRHIARRALEQLAAVNARVAGGILTRVDLDRHSYYYSMYYQRKYSDYYVTTAPGNVLSEPRTRASAGE